MAKSGGTGGRRRFGYDGCFIDLIVFLVIAAGLVWGATRWNAMAQRPFGLGRIPLRRMVNWLPDQVRERFARRSRPQTPTPAPSAAPVPVASPSPTASAPAPTPSPSPSATTTPTPAPTEPTAPSPEPSATPTTLSITTLVPKVTPSLDALAVPATVLCRRDKGLVLGLLDGGIVLWAGTGKKGTVVRPPEPTKEVTAIATSGDGGTVYWITADSPRVLAYKPATKSLRDFTLPSGTIAALAVLPRRDVDGEAVAVLGDNISAFFDGKTGKVYAPSDVLPVEAADLLAKPMTSVFAARAGDKAALLVLSGESVTPGNPPLGAVWITVDNGVNWLRRDIEPTTLPSFSALGRQGSLYNAVALTPNGVAILAPPNGGQTLAAGTLATATWTKFADEKPLTLRPTPVMAKDAGGLWSAPERIGFGPSGLWWTFAAGTNRAMIGAVFHANPASGKTETFLPWNGAGAKKVAALLPDDTGVWVATNNGVRHIAPGAKPSPTDGYSGYLKAAMGTAAGLPPTTNPFAPTLDKLTREWTGVPYKWGGDSRQGIDCSGYVSMLYKNVHIPVPRATNELAGDSSGGKRVRDELRWGDVLVFPGHCAMYVGNGWTSEALVDKGVGRATIWGREQVVVRRFLK